MEKGGQNEGIREQRIVSTQAKDTYLELHNETLKGNLALTSLLSSGR